MSQKTDIHYRKEKLKALQQCIIRREKDIATALFQDFKKPEFEAVVTETAQVRAELGLTLKNLRAWTKPKKVVPSLLNFPSADTIYSEPYGNVLIISPWNYPFLLAMGPLIGAVAAGNKVTLKPSELAPHTAKLLAQIVGEVFAKEEVDVVQGGADVAQQLLAQPWDYIFFTGSVAVGKIVAQAAAAQLTPVTLELGGKNPCIIDENCNLRLAAKRIVWGKMVNAGQTCIAPDYLLVHHKVKAALTGLLIDEIRAAYGQQPSDSPDFARIINNAHWERLRGLLEHQKIVHGGECDRQSLYIAPTLVDAPDAASSIMQQEIFGPILPLIPYEHYQDLAQWINHYEKPLALYVFSNDRKFTDKIVGDFSFGGGCINDTVVHFGNHRLPFGGVGHSGMGAYHGKRSFETFSHQKAMVRKANWLDIPLRYAPYKNKLKLLKKILNWL